MKRILNITITLTILSFFVNCKVIEDEEDFDLDLIDINNPKLIKKILKKNFENANSKIPESKMIAIMYKFLIHETIDNIALLQKRHDSKEDMKHDEEDMLASAHAIQEMVKVYKIDNKIGDGGFSKKDAKNLLNKEKYNEFLNHFAEKILENLDTGIIEEEDEFDPITDL